jgi:glycyl-tRNA synthetase alpha chain
VGDLTYREVFHQNEVEQSKYSFQASDPALLFKLFDSYEAECKRLLALGLPLPAYDYGLKCSHAFNLLDARGAISVTERQGYILRVRALAHECARGYLLERARLGFPMIKDRALAEQQAKKTLADDEARQAKKKGGK